MIEFDFGGECPLPVGRERQELLLQAGRVAMHVVAGHSPAQVGPPLPHLRLSQPDFDFAGGGGRPDGGFVVQGHVGKELVAHLVEPEGVSGVLGVRHKHQDVKPRAAER